MEGLINLVQADILPEHIHIPNIVIPDILLYCPYAYLLDYLGGAITPKKSFAKSREHDTNPTREEV